jgi:hypothetical protein
MQVDWMAMRTSAPKQPSSSPRTLADGSRPTFQTLRRNHTETAPAIVSEALRSPGEPLAPGTRAVMESRFGHDFSQVRVHTSATAAESARAVRARAYTVGPNIVFGTGEYAPQSRTGERLLAHELAHTLEQRQGPVLLQRAPLKDELDQELKEWAEKNNKSLDPKHPDFAYTLQDYAWVLINDPVTTGPIAKPKDPKERAAWEKKFQKAQLLAEMILAGGKAVPGGDARATLILGLMAQAGFSSGPVDLAKGLTSVDDIEYIYGGVLDQAGQADPKSLTTLTEVLTDKRGKNDNPVIKRLTDRSGSFEQGLSSDRLTAILAPLIQKYEKDPLLIEILAETLVFNPKYRETFSTWMWKEGKSELLFQVVSSKYFVEPEYGPEAFSESSKLQLKKDMPWVYAQKQRYYVDYLVQIGKDTAVEIKAPKKLKLPELKTWLDDNTEAIGEAVAKKYPDQPAQWTRIYEQLADIFFYHVDGRNINPDLGGKLSKLKPGAPAKMRLESDCDVLATYAMRYLRGVRDPLLPDFKGFESVGYMAIEPVGPPGHAVALLRRDGQYYVINNKQVTLTKVAETKPDEMKAEALQALKKDALAIYETEPAAYKVFYADSPDGRMPRALARTEASVRRKDLEP